MDSDAEERRPEYDPAAEYVPLPLERTAAEAASLDMQQRAAQRVQQLPVSALRAALATSWSRRGPDGSPPAVAPGSLP
eukprot:10889498-Alexandrium_andersonii.AAC.1